MPETLTKREATAVCCLNGILASYAGAGRSLPAPENAARQAVRYADCLLATLDVTDLVIDDEAVDLGGEE